MSKFIVFALCLNILLAGSLYHTKYKVVDLERQYTLLCQNYHTLEETYHTLKAEHSLLSNPKRLAAIADKYFNHNVLTQPQIHQYVNKVKLASTLQSFSQNNPTVRLKNHSLQLAAHHREY